MKIGTISRANSKGQVVIPKKIRDTLNIDQNVPLNITIQGNSVFIQPIKKIEGDIDTEGAYLNILERSKGSWKDGDWKEMAKKRRNIELKASAKRKKTW
jgi:AbrB family looped-hinge helix DNA binding protein